MITELEIAWLLRNAKPGNEQRWYDAVEKAGRIRRQLEKHRAK